MTAVLQDRSAAPLPPYPSLWGNDECRYSRRERRAGELDLWGLGDGYLLAWEVLVKFVCHRGLGEWTLVVQPLAVE